MIQVFPADERYRAFHGWLESRFSFSFADYYDPNNMRFGPMRVLNDDRIQAGEGFGFHPHREMEIVTIVLKGLLQHKDSMGNIEFLRPGEVQRLTAGTGLIHSEVNPSDSEELHLLQMWFEPLERGLTPSYEQFTYDSSKLENQLLPVVSIHSSEQVAHIHQDMTLYLAKLDVLHTITFEQATNRKTFLFVIEGDLKVNGNTRLEKRDSARITDTDQLQIQSSSEAFFMLIDLP